MSLDCEGDGAACVECGEFDFLPFACPYCRGVFCAAHASCHHTPAAAAPPAVGSGGTPDDAPHASPLCGPPPELTSSSALPVAAANSNAGGPSWPQHRCVVCQSVLCALAPCPDCGDSFCAAHRFHSHANDVAGTARQARRHAGRSALPTPGPSAAPDAATVAALCAPYTAPHPLVLAPPGYRSRRMNLLALVVAPTAAASAAAATPSSEGLRYTVGVCSLIVATEMSVGQLRDRLLGFLLDAATAASSALASNAYDANAAAAAARTLSSAPLALSEWLATASATLWSVSADALASSGAVSTSRQQAPALSLAPLPVDHILRHAPLRNAAVVLHLTSPAAGPPTATPDAEAALGDLVAQFLYGSSAGASAAAVVVASRDDRVRALATRLYLQHQQQVRRATGGSATDAAPVTEHRAAPPPPVATCERDEAELHAEGRAAVPGGGAARDATAEEEAAGWPFRAPPPLNSFDFFNSKLSPCGAAAIRPASAPRIVVALYVADAVLPVAVRPMCIALGRDWPLARVVDRLREEVEEQQLATAHRDARAALRTFSLFHLGNGVGGAAASSSVADEGLTCLWDGQPQGGPSVALQSADVLLLCPPNAPAATAAVRAELRRLRCLTGKPKAALKADQMKKCAVM